MLIIIIKFIILAILTIYLGYKLSVYADKFADAKNLGKGLVGFLLLGFTTSLPELITTVSSTMLLNNPALGAGNIMGSINANTFILAISLLTTTTLLINGKINRENMVSMSMFFVLLSVFFLGIIMQGVPFIFNKSIYSFLIIILFIYSIRALHKVNKQEKSEDSKEVNSLKLSKNFYFLFVIYLVGIVIVSYFLSVVVNELTKITGWDSTSVGAIFLAWATSLPELVVTISTIIIGSAEMGIGNIIGSNIFNLMILGIADLLGRNGNTVYTKNNKIIFLISIIYFMSSFLFYTMVIKKIRKIGKIAIIPSIIIIVYLVSLYLLFK